MIRESVIQVPSSADWAIASSNSRLELWSNAPDSMVTAVSTTLKGSARISARAAAPYSITMTPSGRPA